MAEPTAEPRGVPDPGQGDPRRIRTVPELDGLVTQRLTRAFPEPLWVSGEVLNRVVDEHGGIHFDLVADGPPSTPPTPEAQEPPTGQLHVHLDAHAFGRVRAALAPHGVDPDDLLFDGHRVLVSGQLTYADGRIGLLMDGLDHHATTGMLAATKDAARARLRETGLDTRQHVLPTPVAPTRIAIIGGVHDTGLRGALHPITTSELSIHARSITVALEGRTAIRDLAGAITQAADSDVDLILLVRGDGIGASRAVFDAAAVAHAVAGAPIPVITGIKVAEPTLTDEVAHLACGTPARAGDEVVQRLRAGVRQLHALERDTLERARDTLDRIEAAYTQTTTSLTQVTAAATGRAARVGRQRLTRRIALAGGALAVLLLLVALATPTQRLVLAGLAGLGVAVILWQLTRNHHPAALTQDPKSAGVPPPHLPSGKPPAMPPPRHRERSFEQALDRLEEIRQELTVTSAPETVVALTREAGELRAYCESMLGWAEQSLAAGAAPPPPEPPEPA